MNGWNDEHAIAYDKEWGELAFHTQIPELAKVSDGMHILEVGCGGGFLSICLAQAGHDVQVTALDPTAKMIALTKARQQAVDLPESRLKFIQSGAENLKAEPDTFDLVVAAFSVHHFQDPTLALSLIHHTMKSGARVWLCEDLNTPYQGDLTVDTSLKAFAGLKSLLENTGFKAISQRQFESEEGQFLLVEAHKP